MGAAQNHNYRINVQYDGTRYKGWQIQNSTTETIQGKLETLLSRLLQEPVQVIGSGRTDAGVHAIGQVANFHTNSAIDSRHFLREINHYLPEDIAVTALEEVNERFHARFQALNKTYRYRIHTGEVSNVFERKYVYHYQGQQLDAEKMKLAAKELLGEHDFRSFCGNRHMKKSTIRTVTDIQITQKENEILIDYTGDGFLQNMIRIMTGTLIEIGNGTKEVQDMKFILDRKDREAAGYTVPPQGLCLMQVNYED